MKINLFNELDINHDFTVEHLLNNYFKKVVDYLQRLNDVLITYQTEPFIFPTSNLELTLELKKLIIVSGMLMNKLTESPVFMLHTEMYLTNLKLTTIHAFIFFFNLVCIKLSKDYSDVYAIDSETYNKIQTLLYDLLKNNNIDYNVYELYKIRLG